MFRKCLIGSVLLHAVFIGVFGFARPSPPVFDSEFIFRVVGGEASPETALKAPEPAAETLEPRPVPYTAKRQLPFPESESLRESPSLLAVDGPTAKEGDSRVVETTSAPPGADEAFSAVPSVAAAKPAEGAEATGYGLPGNGLSGGAGSGGAPEGGPVSARPPGALFPEPDVPPVKVYSPGPEYPWKAKANNWEGLVVLKVEVLADGKIGAVQIETSSGYPILDNAAKQAVRTWRYKPALKNGVPVVCYVKVPVRFRLEGS